MYDMIETGRQKYGFVGDEDTLYEAVNTETSNADYQSFVGEPEQMKIQQDKK